MNRIVLICLIIGLVMTNAIHKEYDNMKNLTKEELKSRFLGLEIRELVGIPKVSYMMTATEVPESFDSRTQWPNCIHPIRNQGQCGSCWAFAGTEVLSDRFCIASEGKVDVVLSPQYMLNCDKGDMRCNGGYLDVEWRYLESTGVTTDSCSPYKNGNNPHAYYSCTSRCNDNTDFQLFKATSGSTVQLSDIESIKSEIMTNGPVETGFTVYSDFMSYRGGIYEQNSYSALGGHAVKIVGWGVEDGTDYWIVANSWGPSWGEEGFFRIKQGECGIDNAVIAGLPQL